MPSYDAKIWWQAVTPILSYWEQFLLEADTAPSRCDAPYIFCYWENSWSGFSHMNSWLKVRVFIVTQVAVTCFKVKVCMNTSFMYLIRNNLTNCVCSQLATPTRLTQNTIHTCKSNFLNYSGGKPNVYLLHICACGK